MTDFLYNIIVIYQQLIRLALAPADYIISKALPDLSNILEIIDNYFSMFADTIGFAVSVTCLPPGVFQMITVFFTFMLTVPILTYPYRKFLSIFNK